MSKIKNSLKNLKKSATLAINETSLELASKGNTIYKFGLGQSPFPIPKIIVNELKKHSFQKDYLNVAGLFELRKVIAQYHSIKNKYEYLPEDIIIGPGSKELIFQIQLIMDGCLILPIPSWVSYEPQAKILDKKIYKINTNYEDNWNINSENLSNLCKNIKDLQKILILNSPNNPSGTTHKDLQSLSYSLRDNDITVLSDEIYAELDYSGIYRSISHYYPEGTIISNGLSKWCGAGGWRLGYLVFPKELYKIRNIIKSVASETFTSVSSPIQYAAIKAFSENHTNFLNDSRNILKFISLYILKELKSIGVKCKKPQGGFYMICDFTNVIMKTNIITNSESLCNKILKDIGFAMLPGSDFGIDDNLLISRIAFVDFDGEKAINFLKNEKKLNNDFLTKCCPKIIEGVSKLKKWIRENK